MENRIGVRLASIGDMPSELVLKNGLVVNVCTDEILNCDVAVSEGKIVGLGLGYHGKREIDCTGKYIMPGFIDAHMHIESTLTAPLELAKIIVLQGTTTCISDPHELVNVRGASALRWLLAAVENTPVNFEVMIPSSVPATEFDTNGAGHFTADDMREFVDEKNVLGLGEVMCFNDVFAHKREILDKIELFNGKPIDGHAPNISERETQLYALSGIMTDHECSTFEEAQMKLRAGLFVLIREESGAQNLEAIVRGMVENKVPLDRCAFCSDDKHLEDILTLGHIRLNINKAIGLGVSPIEAIKAATINAARIYGLSDRGELSAGKRADIVVCDSITDISPSLVIKDGNIVTDEYLSDFCPVSCPAELLDTVKFESFDADRIAIKTHSRNHVIGAVKNQLLTEHLYEAVPGKNGFFVPDSEYSKLCVVERHGRTHNVSAAPLKGYGISNGAVATSISHDSHNLIVVGDNDPDIILAAEHVKKLHGGCAVVSDGKVIADIPLEIAGLISTADARLLREQIQSVMTAAKSLGVSEGIDPIINLSFMALPVIPSLRLLDTGLFDADKFEMIEE
ncbi:MAG: adenine deaminase [Oscillospiraceae bacterium]